MKNVMTRAWEIAKQGQGQFGGKVSEYFAQALKMAWAKTKKIEFETTCGSRNNKSWVAEITGTHPKFKLNRQFVKETEENMMYKVFELRNGKTYEVCNAGDRDFIQVVNGQVVYVEYTDVMSAVA